MPLGATPMIDTCSPHKVQVSAESKHRPSALGQAVSSGGAIDFVSCGGFPRANTVGLVDGRRVDGGLGAVRGQGGPRNETTVVAGRVTAPGATRRAGPLIKADDGGLRGSGRRQAGQVGLRLSRQAV